MIALRFVVLALGVALGVFYPFISVILADRGFSAVQIGLVASVGAVGFTLAVPGWGHLADVRLGRPRTLQICAIGAAVAVGALILPWPPFAIAILLLIFWIFESSWQPLADALTVNAMRGRGYARVRLLTSLAFATSTIVAGFVFDASGYDFAFIAFAISAVGMAVAAGWVPDVQRAQLGDMAEGPRRRGFGSAGAALGAAPRLGLVLAAVAMLHVGVIGGFTFLPLRLGDLGSPPSDVALSAGVSAIAEIPAMLIAAGVARRIGLRGMFVGSAVAYAAALASWTFLDAPVVIIATRAFTGVAFAWVVVAVVLTVARLLPAELQATGQALYQTVAFGVAAIVANIVGGLLYEAVGHEAVFGMGAAMAVVAAVIGWSAFPPDVGPRTAG